MVVTVRNIVAIVVRVPGPAAVGMTVGSLALSVQNDQRQIVNVPLAGTGRLLFKPYVAIKVGQCGQSGTMLSLRRQLDEFVPRTSITYPWYLGSTILQAGCYTAVTTISYQGHLVATSSSQFDVSSNQVIVGPSGVTGTKVLHVSSSVWVPVVILLVLVLISGGVFVVWRLRVRNAERVGRHFAE